MRSGGADVWRAAALVAALAGLQACSSGSGSSEVGGYQQLPPVARPQVLNAGAQNTFREGSEVLLGGKTSEDFDGPLLYWRWQQTAGPTVTLVERNKTNVSFTAPDVSASTTLMFRLTVEDSHGDTDDETVSVTVVPAQDPDRFLALDARGADELGRFKVIAALANGASTGATPAPLTLSAVAYLIYPPRTAPNASCALDLTAITGNLPAQTGGGCVIAVLESLTPATALGGTASLAAEWPANVPAVNLPANPTVLDLAPMWWNPHFEFTVPRLDVADFNQQFVASGQRDRMLDLFNAHRTRIVLALTLTAPTNQQAATLLVTSVNADGTQTVIAKNNAGAGAPTTAFIDVQDLAANIAGREAALTGEVYYRTVDPTNTRTTLNAWLEQAGFAADANGTLSADAVNGTGPFAHAVYLNNYDLGFGRDMYTRTDQYGNVYAFVGNYGTLEGAIRKVDSIATVVMEYSPLGQASDPTPKFVKFFTYVEDRGGDSPRVTSMNFDGRGEISTPGNCVICHGGAKPPGIEDLVFDPGCGDRSLAMCYTWPVLNRPASNPDSRVITNGDLGATFLPWDLDSLLFADNDPAITQAPVTSDGPLGTQLRNEFGDFSRSAQAAQLKKLNQAAHRTYCNPAQAPGCGTAAARALVEHWYGGTDQAGNLIGNFNGTTPPPGWRNGEAVPTPDPNDAPTATILNPSTAEDLYRDVYGPYCRMCHTSIVDPALRFTDYRRFIEAKDKIQTLVYANGVMPAARLTMDRFWVPFAGGPSGGLALAAHLAALNPGGAPLVAPGAATAVINGFGVAPNRNTPIRLDGSASLFANAYQWTLTAPTGSQSVLVGNATSAPAFRVDRPGVYTVGLTVNPGTTNAVSAQQSQTVVNRAPTGVSDQFQLTLANGTTLQGTVFAGPTVDSDSDGDTLTVAAIAGQGPSRGTLTLNSNGSFSYTCNCPNIFQPPAPTDSFGYRISDGFGGTADATVTVALIGAPDTIPPSTPANLTVTDASLANGSSFRLQLQWTASSDNNEVIGYNIYRNGGAVPIGSSVTTTFLDTGRAPDTTYTYRVSALDGQNESALSTQQGAQTDTSFSQNVMTNWGALGNQSIFQVETCTSCHTGAFPSGNMNLNDTAANVYNTIVNGGRVNVGSPSSSLILCKPSSPASGCSHDGGTLLSTGDSTYQTILRWISDGAPNN
ncbi:MAG TPA: cadherin-like domain-containing protein [Gammaproteobacteria bacterium]